MRKSCSMRSERRKRRRTDDEDSRRDLRAALGASRLPMPPGASPEAAPGASVGLDLVSMAMRIGASSYGQQIRLTTPVKQGKYEQGQGLHHERRGLDYLRNSRRR
jgi:hypothetical protein